MENSVRHVTSLMPKSNYDGGPGTAALASHGNLLELKFPAAPRPPNHKLWG